MKTRREFLKLVGKAGAVVAVASAVPSALLGGTVGAKAQVVDSKMAMPLYSKYEYASNGERHYEAPPAFGTKELKVYLNGIPQEHNKDYRTDTPDWVPGRYSISFPNNLEKGDIVKIVRSIPESPKKNYHLLEPNHPIQYSSMDIRREFIEQYSKNLIHLAKQRGSMLMKGTR